ncbi:MULTISPECIES: bacteriocin-associated protein [Enterococcus]|uniref:bacteriocin-associated protein n=1 Tax=Enterococcus TaxID=1350 RepID=UPI000A84AA83|nr:MULTISPECIES: bacteriocin-associated protein [Enterococcus]MBL5006387.1 bacteriocin-associated integral membrane protein [Enterococcus lactis]MBL5012387.1 bacteriocin-associated integral membrane protein [Enterococcus lactis]MDQ8308210.1 bacteriocin-associated protein [Enterococcus faecium]MDU5670982.1 bacteriocin-associated protein [Enterococcus faecium]
MNNKLIRLNLFVLFSILSFMIFFYVQEVAQERIIADSYSLPEQYQSFDLPRTIQDDRQNFTRNLTILLETAEEEQLNVLFRETNFTPKITNGKPDPSIDLVVIDYFSNEPDLRTLLNHPSAKHLSTQHYTINYASFNNHPLIELPSFKEATKFVESQNSEQVSAFIESLTTKYNELYQPSFTVQDFQYTDYPETIILLDHRPVRNLIVISLIFFLLFTALWLFDNARKLSILRLNGLSCATILYKVLIKHLLFLFGSCCLVQLIFDPSIFLLNMFHQFAFFTVSIISLLCVIYFLCTTSFVENLNRKSYARTFIFSLYFFKTIAFVWCLASVLTLVELVNLSLLPSTYPDEFSEYAVFYNTYSGKNNHEVISIENNVLSAQQDRLYQYLEENGMLLIGTVSYFMEEKEINRKICVNVNYLQKYPIISVTGQKITISPEETQRVFLVPERLENQFQEIKEHYLHGYFLDESQADFYLIRSKQEIHTFHPDEEIIYYPNVIEVQTRNNSAGNLRQIITGMGHFDPVKVPITQSVEETFEPIKKVLEENYLLDNYPVLTPLSEIKKVDLQRGLGGIKQRSLEILFALYLLITMIAYLVLISLKIKKQKYTIWRLNGISMIKTYRMIFLPFFIQYGALVLYTTFMDAPFAWL